MSEIKFSQILRALLTDNKLSGAELGRKIGVSKETISQYCKGNVEPKSGILIKLADYFGVSCDYLLTGVEHNDRKRQGQIPAYIFINLYNDARELLSKIHTRAELIEENLKQMKEFENELYMLLSKTKSRYILQQSDTQEEN